jgi:predicted dienelactone hydrolase
VATGGGGAGGAPPATDFTQPGPYDVTAEDGVHDVPNCGLFANMTYTLYLPAGQPAAPLVVLGHGFERSRDHMAEMAERMASHGVRVVAFDYCHLSTFDVNHAQNAVDQVSLAAALAGGAPVIHAGYSAGGLSSLLATVADPTAVALLALDAVDNQALGANAAPGVSVPTFGIAGEPSGCNNDNNGGVHLATLVPGGTAVRAVGATHCDFEGPTNWVCTNLCGGEGQEGQRETIRSLATAFVSWQAGVDTTGADWVSSSGATYQALVAGGQIAAL